MVNYNYKFESLDDPNSKAGISIILSFTSGILLSPFSAGFVIFLVVLIILEIFYAAYYKLNSPWSLEIRATIIFAAILGFLIGRTILMDKDPCRGCFNKNFINNKLCEYCPHLDPDNERKKKIKEKNK